MCGRYHVDELTAAEIEKLVRQLDESLKKEQKEQEIYPSSNATVLMAARNKEKGFCAARQQWGFPGFYEKKNIFLARSETALEKSIFKESIQERRCVVPAAWFYEWDRNKIKVTFSRTDHAVVFMAGCWNSFPDGEHFILLTAAANDSVRQMHDRMPLILEREELEDWIFCDKKTEEFLHKIPCALSAKRDYEQQELSLSDL